MLSFDRLIALSPMFLAAIAGITTYRNLSWLHRLLLFQVILYIPTDIYGISLLPENNCWVFNLSMVIEIPLVLLAAMMYFKTKTARLIFMALLFSFFGVYCIDIYTKNSNQLYVQAYLCGGVFITASYLSILFFHFFERKDQDHSLSLTLTCLGISLFFACMAPYLSMMDQLQLKDAHNNKQLFLVIIGSLDKVRYSLTAIAFLLHWKTWPMKRSY